VIDAESGKEYFFANKLSISDMAKVILSSKEVKFLQIFNIYNIFSSSSRLFRSSFCDDITPQVLYFVENEDISSEHLFESEYYMNVMYTEIDCVLFSILYYSSYFYHCMFFIMILNLFIFHF
jgi:hypothetical protein